MSMEEFDRANACRCGSGEPREELLDARGIFVSYVCSHCGPDVKRSYRPEIFTNSNYEADEAIEPDAEVGR